MLRRGRAAGTVSCAAPSTIGLTTPRSWTTCVARQEATSPSETWLFLSPLSSPSIVCVCHQNGQEVWRVHVWNPFWFDPGWTWQGNYIAAGAGTAALSAGRGGWLNWMKIPQASFTRGRRFWRPWWCRKCWWPDSSWRRLHSAAASFVLQLLWGKQTAQLYTKFTSFFVAVAGGAPRKTCLQHGSGCGCLLAAAPIALLLAITHQSCMLLPVLFLSFRTYSVIIGASYQSFRSTLPVD